MYLRRQLAGRERRLEYTLWRKEPCGEERGWIVWKGIHRIVSRWHGDATTDEETEQEWQKHLDRTEAELDRRQEMEWERQKAQRPKTERTEQPFAVCDSS